MAELVDGSPVSFQRQRSRRAWNDRQAWTAIYCEAYDYVLPNRRPGGIGKPKAPSTHIFDMTGPNSATHCAGEIQRQMFPVATPFTAECGPLVALKLEKREIPIWNRKLAEVSNFVYPFMKTGGYDTSMFEACQDLTIGTGVVLPLRGPNINDPLRFMCIPQDDVAIEQDAWGRVCFVSWKRCDLGRRAIRECWPKGTYPADFAERERANGYDPVTIYQDWFRLPDGRWQFVAYFERDGDFIVSETYLTQPVAVMRFYRWPGESYGRGPVLFALPTIKTVNKAQELTLKSAAISMLGIWGYRAGGTFNPDTVRIGPGEMWAMQSTGGLLGPDIQRLDTAAARFDIGKMIIDGAQRQIREALLDTRIFDDGGTPPSATEQALIAQQNAKVHIGAYGRLNEEGIQVIVPRAMEILAEWKLLPNLMTFNQLLVAMYVNSPMAAALKSDQFQATINYYRLAAEVVGPDRVTEYVKTDVVLDRARQMMLVPPDVVPDEQERQQAKNDNDARIQQAIAAQAAVKAAPNIVDAISQPEQQAA